MDPTGAAVGWLAGDLRRHRTPALAIVAAGEALAHHGIFMPLAAKSISQLDPQHRAIPARLGSVLFALVALISLGTALLMLLIAPGFTKPRLVTIRGSFERHARVIIAVVLLGLAVSVPPDGITGLTG